MNQEVGVTTATPTAAPANGEPGGIDIIVSMAERGEIDPKNIDIIDVTDRFLKAIASAPKENLRQSGKILFHASVLLRMKAEALLIDNLDDLNGADDFLDFDADGAPIFYNANNEPIARQITLQDLERALVRRANTRHLRERKVTLEQLIDALREAERIEREKMDRKPRTRIDLEGQPQVQDYGDILELAHDEDIETVIARIEVIIEDVFESEEKISLAELIRTLNKGDWVDAFLAILFLSNGGKILLEQEHFYGPVYLVKPNSTAEANLLAQLAREVEMEEQAEKEREQVVRKARGERLKQARALRAADPNWAKEKAERKLQAQAKKDALAAGGEISVDVADLDDDSDQEESDNETIELEVFVVDEEAPVEGYIKDDTKAEALDDDNEDLDDEDSDDEDSDEDDEDLEDEDDLDDEDSDEDDEDPDDEDED
jgi:segregation and condensation protein A